MKTKNNVKFSPAYLFEEQFFNPTTSITVYSIQYEIYLFGSFLVSYKSTLKEARKELLEDILNFYSTDYKHYYANYGIKNWRQFKKRFLSGSKIHRKAYFHKIFYTDTTRNQVKDYFNDVVILGTYQGF